MREVGQGGKERGWGARGSEREGDRKGERVVERERWGGRGRPSVEWGRAGAIGWAERRPRAISRVGLRAQAIGRAGKVDRARLKGPRGRHRLSVGLEEKAEAVGPVGRKGAAMHELKLSMGFVKEGSC